MRYTGILLMAAAAVWAGILAARSLRERLELLEVFRRMVYHLNARILQMNETLPEALAEVGKRFTEQQRGTLCEPGMMFAEVAEGLRREPERPFSDLWKETFGVMTRCRALQAEDRRSLLELGENLGYADRKMQERTLRFYLERTEESIAALKEEITVKEKLYRSLGIAAGLSLLVILL